jgi:hypothetical protein
MENPMTKVETKNALIESTMLGVEDHGIMTCYLYLDYGDSSGQGFGGASLDTYDKKKEKRVGHKIGMDYIMSILDVVGVGRWEDLIGKHIRVKASMSNVEAIGHITKDKWFTPKELFDSIKKVDKV